MGGLNFWGFGRNLFRVAKDEMGGVGRNVVFYYIGIYTRSVI